MYFHDNLHGLATSVVGISTVVVVSSATNVDSVVGTSDVTTAVDSFFWKTSTVADMFIIECYCKLNTILCILICHQTKLIEYI